MLASENILQNGENSRNVTGLRHFRNLAILDVTNTDERIEALSGLLSSFRASHGLEVLLESRHEEWQESSDNLGILDKLAHVVNNDGGLSFDRSLTLLKTTLK